MPLPVEVRYDEFTDDVLANRVRHSGKRLEVAALDLSGTLDDALIRIKGLARKVVALRDEARVNRRHR